MEIQKDFPRAAIGGFKREEVLQYLDELSASCDHRIAELEEQLAAANSEKAELHALVEEQYQKIVVCTEEKNALQNELDAKSLDAAELARRLHPFEEAGKTAGEIVEAAEASAREAQRRSEAAKQEADQHLLELREQADALLDRAGEQAKAALAQANETAKKIIEPAELQAKQLVEDAQRQAGELVADAKEQAESILADAHRKAEELEEKTRLQVEQNVALSEENERRTRRAAENAQREADELLRRARQTAREERERYDSCLKALEAQKSNILLMLDEMKSKVQSVPITRVSKSEAESRQDQRQTTTEALRRKFTNLNNRDR